MGFHGRDARKFTFILILQRQAIPKYSQPDEFCSKVIFRFYHPLTSFGEITLCHYSKATFDQIINSYQISRCFFSYPWPYIPTGTKYSSRPRELPVPMIKFPLRKFPGSTRNRASLAEHYQCVHRFGYIWPFSRCITIFRYFSLEFLPGIHSILSRDSFRNLSRDSRDIFRWGFFTGFLLSVIYSKKSLKISMRISTTARKQHLSAEILRKYSQEFISKFFSPVVMEFGQCISCR